MPLNDGTGPDGLGPRTGRRLGWCFGRKSNLSKGISKGSAGKNNLFLPVAIAVVTDLIRPNSTIRRLTSQIVYLISERKKRQLPNFKNLERNNEDRNFLDR
jgi:Family of unknown function (DUF5320)